MRHNSWEFLPNSWECMHHTAHCTLPRSRYCVPRGHIPRNDCHNAGNSFPGISENVSDSWERVQNTTHSAIVFCNSFPGLVVFLGIRPIFLGISSHSWEYRTFSIALSKAFPGFIHIALHSWELLHIPGNAVYLCTHAHLYPLAAHHVFT